MTSRTKIIFGTLAGAVVVSAFTFALLPALNGLSAREHEQQRESISLRFKHIALPEPVAIQVSACPASMSGLAAWTFSVPANTQAQDWFTARMGTLATIESRHDLLALAHIKPYECTAKATHLLSTTTDGMQLRAI